MLNKLKFNCTDLLLDPTKSIIINKGNIMKTEMKKIALVMAAGILALFGVTAAEGAIQEIPKFNKVKIVNDVKGYTAEVYLNERVHRGETVHVSPEQIGKVVDIARDNRISKLRLVLEHDGKKIDSEDKDVDWSGPEAKKAKELKDIMGNKLKDINVTLERDNDTLVITIKRAAVAEAVAETVKRPAAGAM